jgi:hypothetical protein
MFRGTMMSDDPSDGRPGTYVAQLARPVVSTPGSSSSMHDNCSVIDNNAHKIFFISALLFSPAQPIFTMLQILF